YIILYLVTVLQPCPLPIFPLTFTPPLLVEPAVRAVQNEGRCRRSRGLGEQLPNRSRREHSILSGHLAHSLSARYPLCAARACRRIRRRDAATFAAAISP